ncbi:MULTISPECIES: SRPBCC family protein [Cupriavidus]|uniref:Uncharacterized protein DUF1857 n=2 Tax=Cupriavidus TaxID=106589 RepID=A0A316EZN7_9BURK|nr:MULTISPECIES: SRPBCC family protein [Cupriavidus]NYI00163.1 hypothetical protein [Cupriavidus plantarum]PWK37345.1 uncharacterized protein DUF1857 [Cupriavidus plantarum]QET01699.1 DUF1857 family protein [Cupriavidus pauculus]REF01911.1 uncharacterized protein DUF1857 [Cupriavidus plantarum]RLK45237.1 uncharacterized protein DUF1857 [Cupriavidus plantarum]
MYAISASFDVNPASEAIRLTRAQMWKGLVQKAEYAVPFVPAMEDCVVQERFDDGFIRQITLRNMTVRERITFTPEVQVLFERIESADNGWITNVLSDAEQGLVLTFTFALCFDGVEAGSAEERRKGEEVRESYIAAVGATIAETRRRVAAGEI